ncbi:MAG: hypothetical protein WC756_17790 [Taibaiella sp.]|jgi:hypothetical protein
MNPYSKPIQRSAAVLKAAKEQVKAILSQDPDLAVLATTTYNQISEIEKRLYGLSGLPDPSATVEIGGFAPLTSVMGINVDVRKPITEADLKPTLTEKEQLLDRIQKFYEAVPTMSNEKVLEVLHEPKGTAILRGVAKLANIEDWRESEFNVLLIEAIKQGIADNKEVEAAINSAENNAFSQEGNETRPWTKAFPESETDTMKEPDPMMKGLDGSSEKPVMNELKDLVKTPAQLADDLGKMVTGPAEPIGSFNTKAEGDGVGENTGTGEGDKTGEGAGEELSGETNPLIAEAKKLKEEGKTIKEIAAALGISTGTASNYTKTK